MRDTWRRGSAVALWTAVVSMGVAAPAAAHHGGTGDYDGSRPLYLAGTVVEADYGFPHATIRISVPADVAAPSRIDGVEALRGFDLWDQEPAVDGAGVERELLLPPDVTRRLGAHPERPEPGDDVVAIAYRRCGGDEYEDEVRVQLIEFAGGSVSYGGSVTRIVDGCPGGDGQSPRPDPLPTGRDDERAGTAAGRAADERARGAGGEALAWLEETAPARAVRERPWLYPAMESVHIAGIAILVGAAMLWDLRVLGLAARISASVAAQHLLPVARIGAVVVAVSGTLLFASNATTLASNPVLQLKLALLGAAVLNVIAFHLGPYRSVAAWDQRGRPRSARIGAVVSLVMWSAIIVCGRFIAYA